MSKYKATQDKAIKMSFALEGRFLGYAADDRGKLKFIRLDSICEHSIKLSKALRSQPLIPGEWVQITGIRQVNPLTGQVKLKVKALTSARPLSLASVAVSPVAVSKPSKPETILVCQKSDCCKLGAKAIASALQTAIQEQGLADQVIVKGTGCMKRCKAGPNLVMPDKTRYTKISPQVIPALVKQHFTPAIPVTADQLSAVDQVATHQPAAVRSTSIAVEAMAS